MQLEKYYNLLYRKEMAYTLQPLFCKVDYRPVNVQCLNSTQDSTILMMVLEAATDVASGIDRHPDRTEIYFRLQIHIHIQGNRKLIPCKNQDVFKCILTGQAFRKFSLKHQINFFLYPRR